MINGAIVAIQTPEHSAIVCLAELWSKVRVACSHIEPDMQVRALLHASVALQRI